MLSVPFILKTHPKKSATGRTIKEVKDDEDADIIRIKGYCGHSAYSIKDIRVLPETAGLVVVKISAGLKRGTVVREFSVDVPLTPTLTQIALAEPDQIIGERPPPHK
jgi:hypothetical protein